MEAQQQDYRALQLASEELRSDREVALEAVRLDGRALGSCAEELWYDRELMLEAVRSSGLTLGLVSARRAAGQALRAYKELVIEAIRQDYNAFQLADETLLGDREVALEAIT